MTDEKKPGEVDAAAEQVEKPKKNLTQIFRDNGFIDVTKPGHAIGFVGAGTPPDSTPEEESPKH